MIPVALLHVEVPQKDVAHRSRAVATERDRRRIQAIASAISGISQVRMNVSITSAYF